MILISSNSGETWFDISPNFIENFTSVEFIDSNKILLTTETGKIYYSANFGKNWQLVFNNPDIKLNDIAVLQNFRVIAVGNYGKILFSSNSGKTWATQDSITFRDLFSIKKLRMVEYLLQPAQVCY